MNILGTKIFWITIIVVPTVLFVITFAGRALIKLLPEEFKKDANMFLSPVFGLSIFICTLGFFGRFIQFKYFIFSLPILLIVILIILVLRKGFLVYSKNWLKISLFSLTVGISLLAPLYCLGAFNAHNDAFIYLNQSTWLQDNEFNNVILTDNITPQNSQTYVGQSWGLRMGVTYFLAFIQASFGLEWAYDAFPSVAIISITIICLGIGYIINEFNLKIKKWNVFAISSVCGLFFGGAVFGSSYGFMPQTIGIGLSISIFAVFGAQIKETITKPNKYIFKTSLLLSVLISATAYAYVEILPLILITLLMCGIVIAIKENKYKSILLMGLLVIIMSAIILNVELIRNYKSLVIQMNALVGTPVNWPLISFIAHLFGVHGGAWDIFQWGSEESPIIYKCIGFLALIVGLGLLIFELIKKVKLFINYKLLPFTIITIIVLVGLVYFRYFVQSPFVTGLGHSWNQFRLVDWGGPFFICLLLAVGVSFKSSGMKIFELVLVIFIIFGIIVTGISGLVRTKQMMRSYGNTRDLSMFYQELRIETELICGHNKTLYLAFDDQDIKERQALVLYFHDYNIESDWGGDNYIKQYLPEYKKRIEYKKGDCVIERIDGSIQLDKSRNVGIFKVGL